MVVLELGKGDLVLTPGKLGSTPAVFVWRPEAPGEIGAKSEKPEIPDNALAILIGAKKSGEVLIDTIRKALEGDDEAE